MSLELSKRHEWVMQSEIRNMSIECDRVCGINLSQGVCDTEVPLVVRAGARQAMDAGINTYTHYAGLTELREAIAGKQKQFYGMEVDPEKEIIVSGGATGALYCACLALLNPGDEVILFEPFYGYHINFSVMATRFTSKGSVRGAFLRFDRPLPRVWGDLSLYLHRPEDSSSPEQIEGHLPEKNINTVLYKTSKAGAKRMAMQVA